MKPHIKWCTVNRSHRSFQFNPCGIIYIVYLSARALLYRAPACVTNWFLVRHSRLDHHCFLYLQPVGYLLFSIPLPEWSKNLCSADTTIPTYSFLQIPEIEIGFQAYFAHSHCARFSRGHPKTCEKKRAPAFRSVKILKALTELQKLSNPLNYSSFVVRAVQNFVVSFWSFQIFIIFFVDFYLAVCYFGSATSTGCSKILGIVVHISRFSSAFCAISWESSILKPQIDALLSVLCVCPAWHLPSAFLTRFQKPQCSIGNDETRACSLVCRCSIITIESMVLNCSSPLFRTAFISIVKQLV